MHTVWKGAISFGLVHIPVKMFASTDDKNVRFRQLHTVCGMPISYVKTCRHCEQEVKAEQIVKGFEYESDRFAIIKDEELDALKPEMSKTIQIIDFVQLAEIDPVYYQKSYYLSPDMAGATAYSLLLEAIKQTDKIGIAKISIRNKSTLAAVRVVEQCLCLETMHFPDEIRPLSQVPNLPEQVTVNDKELGMAKLLIDQLTVPFEPEKYTDDYRIAVQQLVQDKIAGKSPDVVSAPAVQQTNVIDLMAALQASLEEANAEKVEQKEKAKEPV